MLVCKRCRNVGIETDSTVYERMGRAWVVSSKTFSQPAGQICDPCLDELADGLDEWELAQEKLEEKLVDLWSDEDTDNFFTSIRGR